MTTRAQRVSKQVRKNLSIKNVALASAGAATMHQLSQTPWGQKSIAKLYRTAETRWNRGHFVPPEPEKDLPDPTTVRDFGEGQSHWLQHLTTKRYLHMHELPFIIFDMEAIVPQHDETGPSIETVTYFAHPSETISHIVSEWVEAHGELRNSEHNYKVYTSSSQHVGREVPGNKACRSLGFMMGSRYKLFVHQITANP